MKISIIIPAYNVEKYIIQCLESIKQQQYSLWECIVIDDCSSDGTPNLIADFIGRNLDFNFIFKRNSRNLRQGQSRNKGVELSTGDYLMFVDSDDVLPADSLAKLVAAITGNEDIVVGNYASFRDGNLDKMQAGIVCHDKFYMARNEDFSNIYNLVYPWGKIYKSSFWRDSGFNFANVLFEDTVLWPAVSSQASSITVLDDIIYYYRVGNPYSESHLIVPNYKKYYLSLDARLKILERYQLMESYYVSFCMADAYQYINDLPWLIQRYKLFLLLKSYIQKLPPDKFITPNLIPIYKMAKLKKMYRYGLLYFILKPKTNQLKLLLKKLDKLISNDKK